MLHRWVISMTKNAFAPISKFELISSLFPVLNVLDVHKNLLDSITIFASSIMEMTSGMSFAFHG